VNWQARNAAAVELRRGQNGISATPAATNVHLTIYRTVEGEPTVSSPDDDVIDVEPEEISTPEIEAVEDPFRRAARRAGRHGRRSSTRSARPRAPRRPGCASGRGR
jgi:hypothetical protein